MAGAGRPATKNPHRWAVQVGVFGVGIQFRGRDGARVHLRDRPGGGLCCAARCRGCSTHSRPQVTSAGAKPNHGFFGCQQPVAKKFPPAVAAPAAAGRSMRAHCRRRACRQQASNDSLLSASHEKTPRFMRFVRAARNGGAVIATAMRAMCVSPPAASTDAESRRSGRLRRRRGLRVATARMRQSAQEIPPPCTAGDGRSTPPRRHRNPVRHRRRRRRRRPLRLPRAQSRVAVERRDCPPKGGASPETNPAAQGGRAEPRRRDRVSGLLPRAVRHRHRGRAFH